MAHTIPFAGHKRRNKTARRIQQRLFWPTSFRNVAIPLQTTDTERGAEELIVFFSRFGIPREILSDQGSNFMSKLLKEVYRLLRVHPIRTSPYHPQTDGLVERFNKTLKALLRRLIEKEGRDWDKLLPYVLFAYREVPQTSTGFSPFELLYGRDVRGPLDVLKEEWEADRRSNESVVSHVLSIREKMEEMTDLVKENLMETQKRQKRWYNRTARERELQPDEEVLVLLPTSTNKLLAQWQGPYRVLRKVGKVDYEIDMPGKKKRKKIFHVNMLKKWYPPADTSYYCEEITEEGDAEDKDIPVWKEVEQQTTPTIGRHLSKEQNDQLRKLLKQFDKVLRARPGRTSVTQHRIRTSKEKPIRQPPYRLPHAYRETVEKELKEMLEDGIIEPSESDWASPIVLVKKKDNSIRLCVDYRKLNSETQVDAYPMPRIDDILDQIGQARYITTLDLARGYWQVPVAEEDRHKTAFTTPLGLFSSELCHSDSVERQRPFSGLWTMSFGDYTSLLMPIWTTW